jgi:hypothetical protein
MQAETWVQGKKPQTWRKPLTKYCIESPRYEQGLESIDWHALKRQMCKSILLWYKVLQLQDELDNHWPQPLESSLV